VGRGTAVFVAAGRGVGTAVEVNVAMGATRLTAVGRGDGDGTGLEVAVATRAETTYDGLLTSPKSKGPMMRRAPTAPAMSMTNAKMKIPRVKVI
jgi:hypothetical protein